MRTNEEIVTEMMETVCDKICKYPCTIEDQDELDDICCDCPVSDFTTELLNKEA